MNKAVRSRRWLTRGCAALSLAVLSSYGFADDSLTLAPKPEPRFFETDPTTPNAATLSIGSFTRRVTLLPDGLLWKPALASPSEPRCYMKLYQSLDEGLFSSVNDCAIGGTLPVVRMSRPETPEQGFQVDVFAAVFSRFNEIRKFAADDYRFGVPLTYANGPWSFKIAYEHTSCHVGDEFLIENNLDSKDSTRDEVTFGIAFKPIDSIRIYGVFAYAAHYSTFVDSASPQRYVCGAEWSSPGPTGFWGQPFAAVDLEFRGDEDFTPNFTGQVGWQWLGEHDSPGVRFAVEYYDGRSPFGQFIDRHESWVAVGVFVDF